MANYKISRSLNGNQIFWIARFRKTVVARAKSEKELNKLIAARDQTLRKRRSKTLKRKKKLSSDNKLARKRGKRKRIKSKLRAQVEKKKQTLNAQSKNPKKGFWGKTA